MPQNNQIQFRKGTYAEWDAASTTVLASGEPGFVTDYSLLRIGDGVNQWSDLTALNQALTTVVYNPGTTIPKMSVVYINGGQGDTPTVTLAIANSESTSSKTYGITKTAIANGERGQVVVAGALKNLDTNTDFSAVTLGTTLWLSPSVSGGITAIKPSAPDHAVSVGKLIRKHGTQGAIEVNIQNGFELEELHNVAISGVTNNQYLTYNSASGLWVPTSSGIFTSLSINGNSDIVTGTGVANHIAYWGSSSGIVADSGQLVWDSTNNRLGVGTGNPSTNLEVVGDFKIDNLKMDGNTISSTDTNGNITMQPNGNGDVLLVSDTITIGEAYSPVTLTTPNNANLYINRGGSSNEQIQILNNTLELVGTVIINPSGWDNDFKVQGDNDANLLFVDASTDRVGIGTSTPSYKLQVNGSFGATTKSFRIDHPSKPNYTLEYGSLESPYHGVRLTGRGKVVKGSGVVVLPYYLKDLIHDDETINIQITNIKHSKTIYVDEIDLNNSQFTVRADRCKTLGELEFFWTFTGTRKDVDSLVVEAEK